MLIRRSGISFSPFLARKMAAYSLPLVLVGLFNFILFGADKYFLRIFLDTQAVGVYSLGFKFGIILWFLIVRPFQKIWRPFVFSNLNEKDIKQKIAKIGLFWAVDGQRGFVARPGTGKRTHHGIG